MYQLIEVSILGFKTKNKILLYRWYVVTYFLLHLLQILYSQWPQNNIIWIFHWRSLH